MRSDEEDINMNCPLPSNDYEKILLAHGSGGTLTSKLYDKIIFPAFENDYLLENHDSAVFKIGDNRIAFTTDSFVVNPIFFPGGNIGELAVYGTVNDLSVAGANPLYLSCGFIIEEGFAMNDFQQIVQSMKNASENAGVQIITGDTKVVDKGKGDKIYINTSGVGLIDKGIFISPRNCKEGDVIIINGNIAEHGIAVMLEREGMNFESKILSDTAPLNGLINIILKATKNVHVMRDPTRGGVASCLNEIAKTANVGIIIEEDKIPISEDVNAACEILGFDPLYVANEGKVIIIVDKKDADKVLKTMKSNELGKNASIIGEVIGENKKRVIIKNNIGSKRIVDMIAGEQLPRIC